MNDQESSNFKPSPDRYSSTAIWLHWMIAVPIIFNLSIGFFMEDFPIPLRFIVIGAHISAGITVLILTVCRIIWRILHRPPALSSTLRRWERNLAHMTHFCIYIMMVILPLSGWALISANPPKGSVVAQEQTRRFEEAKRAGVEGRAPFASGTARIWWIAPLPAIAPIANIGADFSGVERQHRLHELLADGHTLGGISMILLLLLHLAGALKHQFIDKENQLARMGLGIFSR